jgi:hypothetical protein
MTLSHAKQFWFKANNNFIHNGISVIAGDDILINTEDQPQDGDLILCDSGLVQWSGQRNVQGVATQVNRTI